MNTATAPIYDVHQTLATELRARDDVGGWAW